MRELSIQLTVPVNEITINMRVIKEPVLNDRVVWIAAAYYFKPGSTDERLRYKDQEGKDPVDALNRLMQCMGYA